MNEECSCGDNCPDCEDCGKPYCECECYVDSEEEGETDDWE